MIRGDFQHRSCSQVKCYMHFAFCFLRQVQILQLSSLVVSLQQLLIQNNCARRIETLSMQLKKAGTIYAQECVFSPGTCCAQIPECLTRVSFGKSLLRSWCLSTSLHDSSTEFVKRCNTSCEPKSVVGTELKVNFAHEPRCSIFSICSYKMLTVSCV